MIKYHDCSTYIMWFWDFKYNVYGKQWTNDRTITNCGSKKSNETFHSHAVSCVLNINFVLYVHFDGGKCDYFLFSYFINKTNC